MQKMKLTFNWFFVSAAIASFLLGVVIASSAGHILNYMTLFGGLLIFLALYLLQVLQRFMTSNKVNPFTHVKSGAQNQSATSLTIMLCAFFAIFAGLYLLLRAEVLIGTNLLLLTFLALVMVISFGRFSRVWFDSMSWFFEAVIVSPLMFLLGSAIQEYQFSYLLLVLWIPLFALYSASAITLLFSEYDQNNTGRAGSFIASVGWEKALKFHHGLIVLTYVSLVAYLAVSGSWSSNWPALLLVLISGVEVFLLEQMARGMRPNWSFLRALAIIQFFSLIYLLAYPLLII